MADAEFRDRLKFSLSRSEKLGYETVSYDMGGLGFGRSCPGVLEALEVPHRAAICMLKPAVMLDALEKTDETVVYLDADAFLVKNIDDIETDDYDIGVTYKGGEKRTYINAGVLFIKNNQKAREFLKTWIEDISRFDEKLKSVKLNQLGDQIFLNDLVFSYVSKGKLLNRVKDVNGVRVKFFDYRDYNHHNLVREDNVHPIPESTRIVHLRHTQYDNFKGAISKWGM
jgi:hypothetical protein